MARRTFLYVVLGACSLSNLDIVDFLRAVKLLCVFFDGSVTSWVRSPHRNNLVGGDADSLHLRGMAVDVVYDEPTDLAAVECACESLGLKVRREDDHDHIEPKE